MPEIYSCCPRCGYDKMYVNGWTQVAIRQCKDCGATHCTSCQTLGEYGNIVCHNCKSNNRQIIGCIRNPK